MAEYADLIRVGTRNMSNYPLLRELGRQDKPVLLKRGRASTVEEWVDAAEYVYSAGNPNIVPHTDPSGAGDSAYTPPPYCPGG